MAGKEQKFKYLLVLITTMTSITRTYPSLEACNKVMLDTGGFLNPSRWELTNIGESIVMEITFD